MSGVGRNAFPIYGEQPIRTAATRVPRMGIQKFSEASWPVQVQSWASKQLKCETNSSIGPAHGVVIVE